MSTPSANEILTLAASGLGISISDETSAADWRRVAERLSERMADWFEHTNPHVNNGAVFAERHLRQRVQDKQRIKSMGTQKMRTAFSAWARTSLKRDDKPKNVYELQALEGFQPAWSSLSTETLKSWAKQAGFVFRPGRAKKNK